MIGRSDDHGRTWSLSPLDPALPPDTRMQAANSDLLQLADGSILLTVDVFHAPGGDPAADPSALPVELQGVFIYALRSLDGGRTWVDERPVTSFLQCSADLARLDDGTLVLQYLHRYPDDLARTGIRARVSDDDGATWRDETYVISQGEGDDPNTGSSYPGTIAGGTHGVITVCANTVAGCTRLEAVQWRPEAATA